MAYRLRRISREENDDVTSPFGVGLAQAIFDNADFDEDIERGNRRYRRSPPKRRIPKKRFGFNSTCLGRCIK